MLWGTAGRCQEFGGQVKRFELTLCSTVLGDVTAPELGAAGGAGTAAGVLGLKARGLITARGGKRHQLGQLEGGGLPATPEPAPSAQAPADIVGCQVRGAPPIRPTQGALVSREEMIHVHRSGPLANLPLLRDVVRSQVRSLMVGFSLKTLWAGEPELLHSCTDSRAGRRRYFPGWSSWPCQTVPVIPVCPTPSRVMAGREAEPGWQGCPARPCRLPGAECCPSPARTGGAVAAGRVRAGGSLSSCLLHKGTILGAPHRPHQGTSSPAACLPPPHQKETSLGKGMGTGTAPGAQQRAREATAFLKEQWRGKAGPAGVGSSMLGLEEAVDTHFRHHPSSDARIPCWGRRRLGAGSEV